MGKKYLEGEYLGKKHSCLELAVIQKALRSLIVPAQGLASTSCYKVHNWMKAQGLFEKAHLLQGRSGISGHKDFALIQQMRQRLLLVCHGTEGLREGCLIVLHHTGALRGAGVLFDAGAGVLDHTGAGGLHH